MNQSDPVKNDSDPNAISIEQAKKRILAKLTPCTDHESIDSAQAWGRVCAEDVLTTIDVPSFRASAMDGYAVRVSECSQQLQVHGSSLAGHPGDDRMPGNTAQRITTGARVPDDADAVVQHENTTLDNNNLVINVLPAPGLHIRPPGSDTCAGSKLLQAGDLIGPAEQALLASQGILRINVRRKLRIAVFSTGDELVEPGEKRKTGQINDANRSLLLSMLNEPMLELIDLGIAADSHSALQAIINATDNADLVISSGGVSVGEADHVKAILENNGSMDLWKVAMKPGRPLTFGFLGKDKALFGLPGNPVSAAITCLLFVRPAINYLCGTPTVDIPPMHLPLKGILRKNPGRVEYQRARLIKDDNGRWLVTTTGVQDSHVLQSLHKANCLIELSIDSAGAAEGDLVPVYPFTHFSRSPL
ncbi:molybdopterin molybdotransferase MoeA [bacterium]|nr:molybdopterin molybdotransferase MoeA [bacterium]